MSSLLRFKAAIELIASTRGTRTPIDLDLTRAATELAVYEISLPDNTSDEALSIISATGGIVTVSDLIVMSDQDISVRLGTSGSNQNFAVGADGLLVLMDTSLTRVSLSNASGSTATVLVAAMGA